MFGASVCLMLLWCACVSALVCYSCSGTQREWAACAGDFAPSSLGFNSSRHYLANCTTETSLCFVRSWSSRARHAWVVQRGCYSPPPADPLPRRLIHPRRAMACTTQRLAEGEYRVCLCGADWCNAAQAPPPPAFTRALVLALVPALIYV